MHFMYFLFSFQVTEALHTEVVTLIQGEDIWSSGRLWTSGAQLFLGVPEI